MIKETQKSFNLMKELKVMIHNHGQDNLKQDIILIELGRKRLLKLKIVSVNSLVSSLNLATFKPVIKVLYNYLEAPNPHVLDLLSEMNQSYLVTTAEFNVTIHLHLYYRQRKICFLKGSSTYMKS